MYICTCTKDKLREHDDHNHHMYMYQSILAKIFKIKPTVNVMHYMQVLKTKLLLLLSFQPHSHDLYYTMDTALYCNACTLQRTSCIVYSLIVFYCASCMVLVSSVGVVSVSENIKTKLEKMKATAHNYRLK